MVPTWKSRDKQSSTGAGQQSTAGAGQAFTASSTASTTEWGSMMARIRFDRMLGIALWTVLIGVLLWVGRA